MRAKHNLFGAVVLAAAIFTPVAVAPAANAAGSVWDRVAACESGGRWNVSTGNGFYGGLQFTRQTWLAFGGGRHASTANLASKSAQITVARKVLASQGPGAWPVCSRKAGLTSANGGASYGTTSRSSTRAGHPKHARLAVDGIVGPITRAALRSHGWSITGRTNVRIWQHFLHHRATGVLTRADVRDIQRRANSC